MAAEIVHDDDISGGQRGYQELLDISAKAEAVDRPVDDAGRVDPIAAQCGQEGQRTPAAIRHLGDTGDCGGGALRYLLRYSNDGGRIFRAVAPSLSETEYTVDLDRLPGGDRCRF